jgi:peptide/nickel transport system substrate-binding protein
MRFRSVLRLSAIGLSLLGLTSAPATAQNKNQLVIGYLQYVPNMHPLIQVNNTKLFLMGFVQRPITAYDSTGQNVCVLCATPPTLESGMAKIVDLAGGKKGMQVTIKLRPDANWGDGKPVTAQDIAFTWKMATDGTVGFSNYNPWGRATKVDVVDAKTAVLHLPEVARGYDSWDQILPSHLEQPIYEQYKTAEDYTKQTLYNRETTNPGLWNGAYVMTSVQLGTQVTLEASQHWPQKAQIARVIFSYRDNAAALVQNLLSGDIDATPVSPGGISFPQMLTLRKDHANRFGFLYAPDQNLERLAFQFTNPLLADVRVRRAIAHAIDRETISARLFEGVQPPAKGILVPFDKNFTDDTVQYPYDPAKARALLTEAGWRPGPDGVCANAAGAKMAFDLLTTAGNQTRVQIAQVIQNQLKAVCINVNVKQSPIAVFNGDEMRKRQFNGLSMSSIQFPPSASPRIYLGADGIPTEANSWTGNNFSAYSNAAMDAAIGEVEATLDPTAAKPAWTKIQKQAAEDLPILPLYFYAYGWVAPKDLAELEVRRFVDQPSIWAERWRRQ